MSKKIIYLISIFLMLGLATEVANAEIVFLQDGGPEGILSVEAVHYDANRPGIPYRRPSDYNDPNVYIHHWEEVVVEFDYRSDPNGLEPNIVTGPSMQCLPDVGASFLYEDPNNFYDNSPRMDFRVKFLKSGEHYVWVRGYTNGYVGWGVSNSFHIGLDNDKDAAEVMEIDKRFVYEWVDAFQRDIGTDPAIFDITAGYHTLNIWMREDGLLVEKIVITTSADYDPNEINDGNGPPESPRVDTVCAFDPHPYNGETYVHPDVVLSWQPGDYVDGSPKHRIYLSEDFNDVNDGNSVAILAQQDPNYHPTAGSLRMDWGKTYYWRVDESNATTTWDEGYVWQFTVEPEYYELTYDQIDDVTASSYQAGQEPNNTVDGSGIDEANDTHTTTATDMWLTTSGPPASIKYEFDNTYRLKKMWVWNYNEAGATNNGLQNVTIKYSVDDITYNTVATTTFTQASGFSNYTYGNVVNLDDKIAKYILIEASSNYGGSKCGLSEVRFFYEPLRARFPVPSDEATNVDPTSVILKWRAGREAAQHKIYISDDQQAVINGTAYITTVNAPTTSYNAGVLLPLELGETYYWKINEVNGVESPTEWVGNVWEFDTLDSLVVDDMDDYGDLIGYPWERNHRIYYVWRDGWNNDSLQGNLTGSQVYHWRGTGSGYSEITKVRSGKSMPFYYENDGTTVSKPVATFPNPDNGVPLKYYSEGSAKTTGVSSLNFTKDWACAKALSLWFYGDPNNGTDPNERMYVALEDSSGHAKSVYYNVANGYDPLDVKEPNWHEWNIPLDLFTDVNLADVNRIHIGFGDRINPKKGTTPVSQKWFVVYFDDIRLYPARCVYSLLQPDEDLDNDCVVDYGDIAVMADNWLERDYTETGKLLLRWDFNETTGLIAHDTSGNTGRDGDVNDATWYTTGKIGRCLNFDGGSDDVGDNVSTGNDANSYMDKLHGLSVCLWVRSDVRPTDKGFIVFDYNNYSASGDRRNIRYDAVGGMSGRNEVIICGIGTTKGWQTVESSAYAQKLWNWQHITMTWAVGEPVCLYINGVRDTGSYTNQPIALGATVGYRAVTVGKGKEDDKVNEGWDGLIDDVQIYSHALTAADIAKVMTGATIADRTNIYYPLLLPGELHAGEAQGSRKINFKDYAVLVSDNWLKETLWPEE